MNYSNNEYIKTPAEFLSDWGIVYLDKKKELQALCIFGSCDSDKSDPKEGHLYLSSSTGQYHCKKCGAKGNLVTLAKHLDIDVATLYKKVGKLKSKSKKTKKEPKEEKPKVFEDDLTNEAYECHKDLTKVHRQYFRDRGLSDETIDAYMLGEAEVDSLVWLTIPIFDNTGKVIFFKLRRLPEDEETNPTKYRYTSGGEAYLYGTEMLTNISNQPVFITEGELDALALREWGYVAVSSTGGAGTFKNVWIDMFDNVSQIYFCFDNDTVGKAEVLKHAKKFKNKQVYIIDIPNDDGIKDVTDYRTSQKTKADFENLVKQARKYDPYKLEFTEIEFADALTEFIPSQFFTLSSVFITLQMNVKNDEDVSKDTYVISSEKRIFPLEQFVSEHRYLCDREPKFNLRWSSESVKDYLSNKNIEPDYFALVDKTINTLKLYLDLKHDDWYLVLALWIWGTYFYRLFGSYPYVNVNGLMNSGKTKMLELCSEIAFNGKFLMGSTPAFVIREIHENSSTIFLDEVESLKKASTPEAQTLTLMLNSGYKSGPKIGKMQPAGSKGWDTKEYDPYSPKMIAGINNVSETLQSRSINITMLASSNNTIKNRELDTKLHELQEIRNGFYLSVMHLHKDLFDTYKDLEDSFIQGRNWEVWRPLLALAKVIDTKSEQEGLLYNIVRNFAVERINVDSTVSADDQTIIQLLLALKDMMESDKKTEAFYPIANIKTYLKTERSEEFDWLESTKYIGVSLRRAGIVLQGSETRRFGDKPMRGYQLNLDVINERLKALGFEFGEVK